MQSAIDDFLLARQVEGRSAKTLRFYRQALGGFAAFVGPLPPSSLTAHLMRRYLAHLAESGLATQSQHNDVVAVKICLKYLSDEGDYDLDACQ